MPELPEVETVRRGLQPFLEGRQFERVDVRRTGLRWPFPERMAERLTGARVVSLARRSKYMLAHLDRGETLLIHLGMSGRVAVSDRVEDSWSEVIIDFQKHDHVVFFVAGGPFIAFNDPRRFGAMDLWPTATVGAHPLLARIGPEPLGNGFSPAVLAGALAGRRSAVKSVLLDQRTVAGLGNIYVCEALWRARISPLVRAADLDDKQIAILAGEIRSVLTDAIAAGGSSLRDYRQVDGELGYFQHDFAVYGKEGAQCPRSGCSGTVLREVQGGRSTFHCPACQGGA